MDIKGLSKVRSEVLQRTLESGDTPFDVAFVITNGTISMMPIDFGEDLQPSQKYKARKQVVDGFLNQTISQTRNAGELGYFSFDPILNVDYCFEIQPQSRKVNLYIFSTAGKEICKFIPYNHATDERVEIDRAIKAGIGQSSGFSFLKDKFSKLLGTKKPESLNVIPSMNPIEVNLTSISKKQEAISSSISSQPSSSTKIDTSSFVRDVLSRLDNPRFQTMRASNMGCGVITVTLNMFTNQMAAQYPEWKGLFEFSDHKDHVQVKCKKGFEDDITRKALPCLWKRKSFIENCILFGVEKLVFLDITNNTFDLLEVSKVNPAVLYNN